MNEGRKVRTSRILPEEDWPTSQDHQMVEYTENNKNTHRDCNMATVNRQIFHRILAHNLEQME